MARVKFPAIVGYNTLPTRPEPARQKMAQSPLSGTTQLVDIEEEGLHPTKNRLWLKKVFFL